MMIGGGSQITVQLDVWRFFIGEIVRDRGKWIMDNINMDWIGDLGVVDEKLMQHCGVYIIPGRIHHYNKLNLDTLNYC